MYVVLSWDLACSLVLSQVYIACRDSDCTRLPLDPLYVRARAGGRWTSRSSPADCPSSDSRAPGLLGGSGGGQYGRHRTELPPTWLWSPPRDRFMNGHSVGAAYSTIKLSVDCRAPCSRFRCMVRGRPPSSSQQIHHRVELRRG